MALAEHWNGRKWAIQRITGAGVTAVACPAVRMCMALGAAAERWNGSKWTYVPVAGPALSSLSGVACVSATACVAVGAKDVPVPHEPYDHLVPFAEWWNGRKWATQPVPDPTPATGGSLAAVSCLAARVCMAVGQRGDGRTLTERRS